MPTPRLTSRASLTSQIEAIMAERLGRPCLLTPSGRIALYLAVRCCLSPGDRVLMAPDTDDVVFFIVLAAGLIPVMAPVSADDGNIDPSQVPAQTWHSVAAVLTTNLYGLPDRVVELRQRCARLGIILIEDAAHAIETTVDGRPIGAHGDAAAFSLSKHVGVAGGIVTFADGARLDEASRLRAEATTALSVGTRLHGATGTAKRLVYALGLRRIARRAYRRLGLDERRDQHRMPLRTPLLRDALRHLRTAGREELAGQVFDRFDPWTRVDLHGYREPLPVPQLERIIERLRGLDRDRARRIDGVERLRELDLVAPVVRRGAAQPLFRVPLMVADRDAIRAALERHDIYTGYIYDQPLDEYAGPELAEPSPFPGAARWWTRHALPVDPLDADRILAALGRIRPGAAGPRPPQLRRA